MNRETKSSLRLINAFIVALGVLIGIVAIMYIGNMIESPKRVSIPVKLDLNLEDTGHLQYESIAPIKVNIEDIQGEIVYKIDTPANAPINWIGICFSLVIMTLLFFVIFLTHKIMQTTLKEGPFLIKNANRMRWIGYSLVGLGLIRFFMGVWNLSIIEESLVSQYVNIENCYSATSMGELIGKLLLSEIPIGLFALFVAAIFKYGIELRKENELTI